MKVSRIIGEVQNEIHRVVDVAWISHGKDRALLFDGVTVGYVTEGSPNGRAVGRQDRVVPSRQIAQFGNLPRFTHDVRAEKNLAFGVES